eukprot:TRINITY_DN412_c0_g1_i1.p1 TRINITY_DN412_c0_g1~~TRINITY_DN412_c0_g1_i1.p1  ORF type:complete len:521 (+),score=123.18 TRINITY_DN412_c0_g1_i1:302-1864(+)
MMAARVATTVFVAVLLCAYTVRAEVTTEEQESRALTGHDILVSDEGKDGGKFLRWCDSLRQTRAHPTNPNQYMYRKLGPPLCRWSRWSTATYLRKPFPAAVYRGGRWYANSKTNRYYAGGGQWRYIHPGPHPTNPTLGMLAGTWQKKTNLKHKYYLAPNGKWYRDATSNWFYRGGRWFRERRRNHPTDPRLWWGSGAWRMKPAKMMYNGGKTYQFRYGRWYKDKLNGKLPAAFQFWDKGHWKTEPTYLEFRNNPFYRVVNNKLVRIPKKTKAMSKYYYRNGHWFHSKWSIYLYKDLKWVKEDPRWRDPHWDFTRRNGKVIWTRVHDPDMKNWDLAPCWEPGCEGWLYYQDKDHDEYWWYGKWRERPMTQKEEYAFQKRQKLRELKAQPAPINLHHLVDTAIKPTYKQFIRWFLRDYLGSTVQDREQAATTDPREPEPGAEYRLTPEPQPPRKGLKYLAKPPNLRGTWVWEDKKNLTPDEKKRFLDTADRAAYREHRERLRREDDQAARQRRLSKLDQGSQ